MAEYLSLDFTSGDLQGMTVVGGGSATFSAAGVSVPASNYLSLGSIASIPLDDFEVEINMQSSIAGGAFIAVSMFFALKNMLDTVSISVGVSSNDKPLSYRDFTIAGAAGSVNAGEVYSFLADTPFKLTFRKEKDASFILIDDVYIGAIDGNLGAAPFELAVDELVLNARSTGANTTDNFTFRDVVIRDLTRPPPLKFRECQYPANTSHPTIKTHLGKAVTETSSQLNHPILSGKHYWEMKATTVAHATYHEMGLASFIDQTAPRLAFFATKHASCLANSANGIATGFTAVNPWAEAGDVPLTDGDMVMYAFDADARLLWMGLNGVWGPGGADPATATKHTIDCTGAADQLYISCSTYQEGEILLITDAASFTYTPPEGFSQVDDIADAGGGGGISLAPIIRAGGVSSAINNTFYKAIQGAFR